VAVMMMDTANVPQRNRRLLDFIDICQPPSKALAVIILNT